MEQPKYLFIQALRGIAALWVVIFHAREGAHMNVLAAALPRPALMFIEAGWMGVPIFFALSGFVIAMSIEGADITPRFLGRFAARRFIRLDPPYWAAIALTICFAIVSAKVKDEVYVAPGASAIAAHLVYLQVILNYPTINVIFWTLTFEVQFYLFFISAMLARQQFGGTKPIIADIVVYGTMFAIAVLWSMQLVSFGSGRGIFVDFWGSFFVGVLAFWGGRSSLARAGMFVLALGMLTRGGTPQQAAAVTGLILFGALRTGFIVNGLRWPWLQGLGTLSYSLYLIHGPVQGAAFFIAARFMPATAIGQSVGLVVTTAMCIMAALCFWWVVERPSHMLARRFGRRQPPPSSEAAVPAI